MTTIVLFQKEISPAHGDVGAREVSVLGTDVTKSSTIEKEAMRKIRFGFRAYLVKFTNLPPDHMIMTACEEAVRNKTVFPLPLVTAKPVDKVKFFRSYTS